MAEKKFLLESLAQCKTELSKLLCEYEYLFDESFPVCMVTMSDERLTEVLRECLKTRKPYKFDEETKKLIEDPNVLI